MVTYFWDTGIFIGYALYLKPEKLTDTITQKDIDFHADACFTFVEKTKADKHITSSHTKDRELPKLLKRKHAMLLAIQRSLQDEKTTITEELRKENISERDTIEAKRIFDLREKINDDLELFKVITDLLVQIDSQIDYLVQKVISKVVLSARSSSLSSAFHHATNNPDDGIILATATEYNTDEEKITVVTVDAKDFRSNLQGMLEEPFKTSYHIPKDYILPKIEYVHSLIKNLK